MSLVCVTCLLSWSWRRMAGYGGTSDYLESDYSLLVCVSLCSVWFILRIELEMIHHPSTSADEAAALLFNVFHSQNPASYMTPFLSLSLSLSLFSKIWFILFLTLFGLYNISRRLCLCVNRSFIISSVDFLLHPLRYRAFPPLDDILNMILLAEFIRSLSIHFQFPCLIQWVTSLQLIH